MEPRVHGTLGVPNLERAKAFYLDGLGIPATVLAPDEVVFWEAACNPRLTFHPDRRIAFAEPTS